MFVRQVQQNLVFTIGRHLLVRSLHQLQSSGRGFRLAFRHHPDFRASRKIDRQVRIERHFAQKVAEGTMPQFLGGPVAQFRSVPEQFIKLRGAGSVQGEEFLVERIQFAKGVEIRQELTVVLIEQGAQKGRRIGRACAGEFRPDRLGIARCPHAVSFNREGGGIEPETVPILFGERFQPHSSHQRGGGFAVHRAQAGVNLGNVGIVGDGLRKPARILFGGIVLIFPRRFIENDGNTVPKKLDPE